MIKNIYYIGQEFEAKDSSKNFDNFTISEITTYKGEVFYRGSPKRFGGLPESFITKYFDLVDIELPEFIKAQNRLVNAFQNIDIKTFEEIKADVNFNMRIEKSLKKIMDVVDSCKEDIQNIVIKQIL
jgi:hypothetical protein